MDVSEEHTACTFGAEGLPELKCSTLRMEAVCSPETPCKFYQISWCHAPVNSTCLISNYLYVGMVLKIYRFQQGGVTYL
jgi:hypothetical protein